MLGVGGEREDGVVAGRGLADGPDQSRQHDVEAALQAGPEAPCRRSQQAAHLGRDFVRVRQPELEEGEELAQVADQQLALVVIHGFAELLRCQQPLRVVRARHAGEHIRLHLDGGVVADSPGNLPAR